MKRTIQRRNIKLRGKTASKIILQGLNPQINLPVLIYRLYLNYIYGNKKDTHNFSFIFLLILQFL